jgi:hypothetical protein
MTMKLVKMSCSGAKISGWRVRLVVDLPAFEDVVGLMALLSSGALEEGAFKDGEEEAPKKPAPAAPEEVESKTVRNRVAKALDKRGAAREEASGKGNSKPTVSARTRRRRAKAALANASGPGIEPQRTEALEFDPEPAAEAPEQAPQVEVPAALVSATSFRQVMTWMVEQELTGAADIVAKCEELRPHVPAIGRLRGDLTERVARALSVLALNAGASA